MYFTGDEAGMYKIVREVYVDLPETNEDPELLADRSILCPMNTHVLFGAYSWRNSKPLQRRQSGQLRWASKGFLSSGVHQQY
jgi:hypothetical protein